MPTSSTELDDEILFANTTEKGPFRERMKPSNPPDCFIRSTWERLLKEHWLIPPTLDGANIVKYPKTFICPFYEETEVGHGSFGKVFRARVSGGHLRNHKSVSTWQIIPITPVF